MAADDAARHRRAHDMDVEDREEHGDAGEGLVAERKLAGAGDAGDGSDVAVGGADHKARACGVTRSGSRKK